MAENTTGTSVAIATPDLEIIEGQITTTSNQVAAHFGKRHADVIRAIKKMEIPAEYRERNFALTFNEVPGPNGAVRKDPAYRITRDGFTLLAMGFTGKEAMQWKVAYLTAFNQMEQELLARTPYTVQPGDKLTEAQQQALRTMLESNVKRLPKEKQAGAMVQGWSKLKAHFGVPYRQIPASEFTEALSIVARHVSAWELLEDEPKATTQLPKASPRRWLMVDSGDGPPVITELAADAQIISQAEIAKQAHRARIEELQRQIAEQEKLAKDHRDTMFIYEKFAKPGDRAKWLSHVAQAAQADWYAESFRQQLVALVPNEDASRANAALYRQVAPGRLERVANV